MMPLSIKTPLIPSTALSQLLGTQVMLKLESSQPSGSFKSRGIGYLCREYQVQGKKLLVSSSGGNAGLAVAYAGKVLGLPVKVIVPHTTSEFMKIKIRLEGADVLTHGESWNEADQIARDLSKDDEVGYVSPFDHPLIWKGHSSMIQELKEDGYKPDAVLLSVGGGGLYCGVVQGLRNLGWNDVSVITAETEGAASFYQSIQAGKLVTLEKINTIASSLGAKRVAEKAFEFSQKHPTRSEVVTDVESLKACYSFLEDHRLLVEPACSATLSLIYQRMEFLKSYKSILVIVCGGSNVNLSMLQQWSEQLLEKK